MTLSLFFMLAAMMAQDASFWNRHFKDESQNTMGWSCIIFLAVAFTCMGLGH